MLMLAIEANKQQVIDYLLSIGYSINTRVEGKTAADLAWENKHQNVLLKLLKSGSLFPVNFESEKSSVELSTELKNFTESVTQFFDHIETQNKDEIKKFITSNRSLGHIFNTKNESAAAFALKHKKFDIYEVLVLHNLSMFKDENMDEITAEFTAKECSKIKNIHDNSAKGNPQKHVKILAALSKVGHDNTEVLDFMKHIEDAFYDIDKIPKVREILQAVAKHPSFMIYFDFNRTSVNHLDPNMNIYTNGAFYLSGRIYIAAKDLLDKNNRQDVLAVIVHELCHFATLLSFKNEAKPYEKSDTNACAQFEEINAHYLNCFEQCKDEIISQVYIAYSPQHFHAELIVRAPQLLTLYHDNKEELERIYKEHGKLLAFYENDVLPSIEKSIPSIEDVIEKLKIRDIENTQNKQKINDLEEKLMSTPIAGNVFNAFRVFSITINYPF